MRRWLWVLLGLSACSSNEEPAAPPDASPSCAAEEAPLPEPALHTPRWAFRPWISKDISTRDDTYAFVKGFEDRDIPVGVVVLDSPWETNYNTFVPNPKRYGDFEGMLKDLHSKNIRLVLWTTQMVNKLSFDFENGGDHYDGPSPDYEPGLACGYFLNKGEEFGWWKGTGGAVDFFNPRARTWFHALQKPLLDLGVDGWKLDFGDSYVRYDVVSTAAGDKPHQAYSEEYYRDFLAYGRSVRGNDFLTMVRPWDASYEFKGRFFARREHAPVAWVGDNRRDWFGLKDALDHIMVSARAGYVVIGSDLGGYLDRDDKNVATKIPADTLTFARWTAMAAWTPFFQLHGRANSSPWTVADHVEETVAMYRYWAKLHDALVPFFYSLAEEHWAKGGSMLTPVGTEPWTDDYRFRVGDAFLVAPIVDATGKRSVELPAGQWFDWWTNDAVTSPVAADVSADRIKLPVYVREGAIVPLDVVDDANGLGTKASKGLLTVLAWPGEAQTSFVLRDDDGKTTTIEAKRGSLSLSRVRTGALVRIRAESAPTSVRAGADVPIVASRDALDAVATGAFYDAAARALWVKVPKSDARVTIEMP